MANDSYIIKVQEEAPLLEYLLKSLPHLSRNKIKDILQGRGITVNGKCTTQFDLPLRVGQTIAVSKQKRSRNILQSRYVKIVYEDRWLVVVEKNIGIRVT